MEKNNTFTTFTNYTREIYEAGMHSYKGICEQLIILLDDKTADRFQRILDKAQEIFEKEMNN